MHPSHCKLALPGHKFATIIYMIFTDTGIILYRQPFREADLIVSLYTRDHGRINARVPGVSRATGKLKALCEPLAWADYRFYVKRGGVLSTITGGKLCHVFPTIRGQFSRMALAMHCCELVMRLTPLHQVSREKFDLLASALTELEYGEPTPAFAAAFTLRLMTLAGFGIDHPVLQISTEFWQRMHEDQFSHLVFDDPQDLLFLAKCNNVVRRFLDHYLAYPLNTLKPIGLESEVFPLLHEEPVAL